MITLLKTVESVNVKTEEILVVKLCKLGLCPVRSKYFHVQLGKHHIAAVSKPFTNQILMFSITEAEITNIIFGLCFFSLIFLSDDFPAFLSLSYNYTDLELFKYFLFS